MRGTKRWRFTEEWKKRRAAFGDPLLRKKGAIAGEKTAKSSGDDHKRKKFLLPGVFNIAKKGGDDWPRGTRRRKIFPQGGKLPRIVAGKKKLASTRGLGGEGGEGNWNRVKTG